MEVGMRPVLVVLLDVALAFIKKRILRLEANIKKNSRNSEPPASPGSSQSTGQMPGAKMRPERIGPLRYIRRKLAYWPIDVSSLYTEVPPADGRIPNRVYQTWTTPVLPLLLALEVIRFRRLNPDYSFAFFDDRQMADYMDSHYAEHPIFKVFKEIRIPVVRADIWRYCLLFREGGIYCDIKSVLTVPLREIVHSDYSELISFEWNKCQDILHPGPYADPKLFLAAPPDSIRSKLEYPDNSILNWLVCFEKGSPILEEVINLIVRHAEFYRNRRFENVSMAGNHFTGVIALTQAVWMWMQKTGKRPQQYGVHFHGRGIWKLHGMIYGKSPHHTSIRDVSILE
jgi:hypothetical protein